MGDAILQDPENAEQTQIQTENVVPKVTLDGIIVELHNALDQAQSLISRYNVLFNTLTVREENVNSKEVNVSIREKVIGAREDGCKKIEDVIKLKKDAQALLDSANLRLNEAVAAEKALATHTQEQMGKLQETRLLAQKEQDNVNKQREDVEKEISARVDSFLIEHGFKKEG